MEKCHGCRRCSTGWRVQTDVVRCSKNVVRVVCCGRWKPLWPCVDSKNLTHNNVGCNGRYHRHFWMWQDSRRLAHIAWQCLKKNNNPSTSLHIAHTPSRLYNLPPLFRLHSSLRPVIRFGLHTHPLRDKPNSEVSSPPPPHSQSVHDVKSPNPSVDVKQVHKHIDQHKQALSSQDLSKANLRT